MYIWPELGRVSGNIIVVVVVLQWILLQRVLLWIG